MSDNRHILVFDFETGGRDTSKCEIIQIGAVVINRNSLKIKDEFETMMKPDNFDALEDEALKVNHITREQLADAPDAKTMFPVFAEWIKKHNIRKDKGSFGAPIPSGWGIDGFDLPLFTRYCKQYGYWDKKWNNQSLLNPIFTFDVMKHVWFWFRANGDAADNIKLPTVLEYMGVDQNEIASGAHNALWDVKWTAKVAVKLLQVGSFLTEPRPDVGTRRLEMRGCFTGQKL